MSCLCPDGTWVHPEDPPPVCGDGGEYVIDPEYSQKDVCSNCEHSLRCHLEPVG